MIRFLSALYFVLTFMLGANAMAAHLCANIFAPFKMTAEIQKSIASTITALAELRLSIDQSQAQGKNSIDRSVLATNYVEKENTFARYLIENKVMTAAVLKETIKAEISVLQGRQKNNRSAEDDAEKIKVIHRKIKDSLRDGSTPIFHRINPGSFEMGSGGSKKSVTLTKPFEMMATPTTQIVWHAVAQLYNTKIRDRKSGQAELNLAPSQFNGANHPVETVKYVDVQIWITALNTLSKNGDPALFELIPDHKIGDTYRLPTEAEWEFVARGRGQYNEKYPFGPSATPLTDYAWYGDNSKDRTHPVAQKLPVMVDGQAFYDLMGNVQEMTVDNFGFPLPGGTDPIAVLPRISERSVRGGSWMTDAHFADLSARSVHDDHEASNTIGFRLIREVRP